MKKTLLVDTNRAAVPIYRALCALGHDVWVVGGKPTETLAKLARNYVELDYSDASRLDSFIDQHGFDYVVPGCTDLSYQVCAEINRGRFPGIDTPANTSAINSKSEFRRVATKVQVPVPRVLSANEAMGVESVIVKPVDAFSGRGITVLRKPDAGKLRNAIETASKASKTGSAIIEEFVEGQLYSHSAFVWDGEVVADFIIQEDCTTNPFAVDTSRMSASFPGAMLLSLREDVCRLAVALRLMNGLIHTQFIACADRYWVIEMTRRCPGDLYSLLVEFSTGYPYAASYVSGFVGGMRPPCRERGRPQERITRHTVTSTAGDSLWGFSFTMPVDIRLFVPLATSGDVISPSPYGRAGIFFFRSPTAEEQDRLYRSLLEGRLYSLGGQGLGKEKK